MLLNLTNARQIGSGTKRLVFVHPNDPSLLVKVVKPPSPTRFCDGVARLRWRYVYTASFLRELREHLLLRMEDPDPPAFLAPIIGFVKTDLGLGLVVKAMRGRDREYAENLRSIAIAGRFDANMQKSLDVLFEEVRATAAIVGDLTCRNIVYAYTPERGDHFVLIDGLGDRTLIPLQRIGFFRRRGKERGIARVKTQLDRYIRQSKGEALPLTREKRMRRLAAARFW